MNRKELERRIIEAADGLLTASEIDILKQELADYPDLHQDYIDITGLADISRAYGHNKDSFRNHFHIHRIKNLIEKEHNLSGTVEEITLIWFKKYVLAAAVVIFCLTSLAHLFVPQFYSDQSEITLPELFYPYEESNAEAYVTYLDELIEE